MSATKLFRLVSLSILATYMALFGSLAPAAFALTKNDVQSILNSTSFYDPTDAGGCGATGANGATVTTLTGGDNPSIVFNFFTQNGFSPIQAAGLIGNMQIESGIDPLKYQGDEKDHLVPPGTALGWGIVQWTPSTKITDYATSVNKPASELGTQLEFLLKQLLGTSPFSSEKKAGDDLKSTTTIEDAVRAFQGDLKIGGIYPGYERPVSESASLADRIAGAKLALEKYGGGVTSASAGSSASSSNNSSCSCSTAPVVATNGGKPTIVLDPGHAPKQSQPSVDAATNIVTTDSENDPEMQQMFDVATAVSAKLTADGYNVILTKNAVGDYVDLKQRAVIANRATADLGISLHSSPGSSATQNTLFSPKVGEFRYTADGQKAPAYADQKLSTTDQNYSNIMSEARKAAEGSPVRVGSYGDLFGFRSIKDSPPLMQKGNVLTTQYFATVPWLYSEKAQDAGAGAVSSDGLKKYENGIINGIEKIIPSKSVPAAASDAAQSTTASTPVQTGCGGGAVSGNLLQTVINYAWPDFHQSPYLTYKGSYKVAIAKAQSNGEYVGGGSNPGVDCGGFITRVMRDSGADPNYNWGPHDPRQGNTSAQKAYMDANPQKYEKLGPQTSTTSLQPGDIAINGSHTYMYVGVQPNFHGNSASASYSTTGDSWRTPMASNTYWSNDESGPFIWYRLK